MSKYSSWSESYSKSYFKGGYSWTETVSGYDYESVTKRDVSTSNGSSWSWTRSGTEYDDGPNSWSESWSKSSWKDGEYLPGEYEVTGGSFHPEGTGTHTNNLPEFGEAPRLNKAPKGEVPIDLQKPPKPSDDIWTPPLRTVTPPREIENAPDNWFAGAGGIGGQPDVSNMTFIQKLKAAIQLVPGLLVGDAKAAFQQLVDDPQFLAALIAVGLAFAALQAIPGVGQAIDAMLILLCGFSAGYSLGSFFFKAWQAKDEQGLRAAANDFNNVLKEVGVLTVIWTLKLAARLLRSLRGGTTAMQVLKFPLDLNAPPGIILESAQPTLLDSKFQQVPGLIQSMVNGEAIPPIAGFRQGNRYIISEGNHRMAAALKLYEETGNPQYVQRLLEQGRWTEFSPEYVNKTYRMTK
ncbi:hypothetical protein [Microcoleus sp. D3_18a_C4]|uniref:hypothetical protein n=1 Tax=unclassified Microcoleus TaxID=2642155 RepID=UPI002FD06D2E